MAIYDLYTVTDKSAYRQKIEAQRPSARYKYTIIWADRPQRDRSERVSRQTFLRAIPLAVSGLIANNNAVLFCRD